MRFDAGAKNSLLVTRMRVPSGLLRRSGLLVLGSGVGKGVFGGCT